jgi:hypothetical protein
MLTNHLESRADQLIQIIESLPTSAQLLVAMREEYDEITEKNSLGSLRKKITEHIQECWTFALSGMGHSTLNDGSKPKKAHYVRSLWNGSGFPTDSERHDLIDSIRLHTHACRLFAVHDL